MLCKSKKVQVTSKFMTSFSPHHANEDEKGRKCQASEASMLWSIEKYVDCCFYYFS